MDHFVSAAIGALFGILTGLGLEWWKSEREDLATLCRGLCDLVADAADAGATFWLTPAADAQTAFLSVRIAGFQSRIDGYTTILIGRLDEASLDNINDKLARFFGALTGQNADDPARPASRDAAITVHDAASAATIAIRQGAFQRVSFWASLGRFIGSHFPNKRVAIRFPKFRK